MLNRILGILGGSKLASRLIWLAARAHNAEAERRMKVAVGFHDAAYSSDKAVASLEAAITRLSQEAVNLREQESKEWVRVAEARSAAGRLEYL